MYPRNATRGVPNGTRSADEWEQGLQNLARRLRQSVPVLSETESQLLDDLLKGRYPMVTLRRLLAIAARAANPAERDAVVDLCRAEEARTAKHREYTTAELFVAEENANHETNLAQHEYLQHPDRVSRARLLEAATAQRAVTDRLIEHCLVG